MTQEDKELLLKDISTRLPYRVKMNHIANNDNEPTTLIGIVKDMITLEGNGGYSTANVEEFKPYLFPMSSMTEEQKEEYYYIVNYISPDDTENLPEGEFVYVNQIEQLLHFYHINHLDYRGLIPKGLALDATGLNIY